MRRAIKIWACVPLSVLMTQVLLVEFNQERLEDTGLGD